jgi:HK97 gp10 family phage protein
MNLLQFAGAMAAASVEIDHAMREPIAKGCEKLEKSAKNAMGDPGNGFGWPPLKPETIARKANGDTPLVETGELRDSIEHNSDSKEGYVGTNNEKAVWHEFGTSKIPARPFLGGAVAAVGDEVKELFGVAAQKAIMGRP